MARRPTVNPDAPTRICLACDGTGARPGALALVSLSRSTDPAVDQIKCPTCGGRGRVIAPAPAPR
jgi:DnaJ-class molecular chaperone